VTTRSQQLLGTNLAPPETARTRSGVAFSPAEDVWKYRDGVKTIRLGFDAVSAPDSIRESFKRVLTWYAENESPSHVINLFSRFKHFASAIGLMEDPITSIHLINYRSMLTVRNEWYVGALSGLFKRWHAMCVPGISDDATEYLRKIRIKGNRKGEAVQTMDPLKGRFTDVELEGVRSALQTAYVSGVVDKGAYVLALMFIALGPRPVQLASLKVCDLEVCTTQTDTSYFLRVPRAKKREPMARSSFKRRPLIRKLGELLHEYAEEVRQSFAGILDDASHAPMFPARRRRDIEPPGFVYHRTSTALSHWFHITIGNLLVHSERTGERLHLNPTRFRRTLASRAADEGHGEFVIADMLDHEDTQNVGPYVEASQGMMERIDRAVALRLAPLAQAFAGKIIADEVQAQRAGDPTSRIREPRCHDSPVGNCGQFGFCGLLAPVACYTCRSFEPWLDGPHEAVLEYLIAERDRFLAHTDKRIAAVNDRTILAVAEVVRRCSELKQDNKERIGV
jgi:integrase